MTTDGVVTQPRAESLLGRGRGGGGVGARNDAHLMFPSFLRGQVLDGRPERFPALRERSELVLRGASGCEQYGVPRRSVGVGSGHSAVHHHESAATGFAHGSSLALIDLNYGEAGRVSSK